MHFAPIKIVVGLLALGWSVRTVRANACDDCFDVEGTCLLNAGSTQVACQAGCYGLPVLGGFVDCVIACDDSQDVAIAACQAALESCACAAGNCDFGQSCNTDTPGSTTSPTASDTHCADIYGPASSVTCGYVYGFGAFGAVQSSLDCLNCGRKLVQTLGEISTNGCGSSGDLLNDLVHAGLSIFASEFTACCNVHDTCFGTCSSGQEAHFDICNADFKDCMFGVCKNIGQSVLGKLFALECLVEATAIYEGVDTYIGFDAYSSAQTAACQCVPCDGIDDGGLDQITLDPPADAIRAACSSAANIGADWQGFTAAIQAAEAVANPGDAITLSYYAGVIGIDSTTTSSQIQALSSTCGKSARKRTAFALPAHRRTARPPVAAKRGGPDSYFMGVGLKRAGTKLSSYFTSLGSTSPGDYGCGTRADDPSCEYADALIGIADTARIIEGYAEDTPTDAVSSGSASSSSVSTSSVSTSMSSTSSTTATASSNTMTVPSSSPSSSPSSFSSGISSSPASSSESSSSAGVFSSAGGVSSNQILPSSSSAVSVTLPSAASSSSLSISSGTASSASPSSPPPSPSSPSSTSAFSTSASYTSASSTSPSSSSPPSTSPSSTSPSSPTTASSAPGTLASTPASSHIAASLPGSSSSLPPATVSTPTSTASTSVSATLASASAPPSTATVTTSTTPEEGSPSSSVPSSMSGAPTLVSSTSSKSSSSKSSVIAPATTLPASPTTVASIPSAVMSLSPIASIASGSHASVAPTTPQSTSTPASSITPPPTPASATTTGTALPLVTSPGAANPMSTPDVYLVHPNGLQDKCLDVSGNARENGTAVQIYDCNGTGAQRWSLNRDETKLQLVGSDLCLDAGLEPGDFTHLKIWKCFDGLFDQDFWYTTDDRIALKDHGLCMDLTDGITDNGNPVQLYRCTDQNTNQIWTVELVR